MFTFSGFNWLLLYFSVKTNSSVRYHFLNIHIVFSTRSRSCWHGEYKPGFTSEPLALKASLFTWSVQWLLLQCAAALQRCMEQTLWSRLRCWAQCHWYFTHFKLFYFPNIIGLVQRIVRFVMRTEPKALYQIRTLFNTNIRIVTPLVYMCVCIYIYIICINIYKKYTHTHTYIYIYIYIYICICVCVCVCIFYKY